MKIFCKHHPIFAILPKFNKAGRLAAVIEALENSLFIFWDKPTCANGFYCSLSHSTAIKINNIYNQNHPSGTSREKSNNARAEKKNPKTPRTQLGLLPKGNCSASQ